MLGRSARRRAGIPVWTGRDGEPALERLAAERAGTLQLVEVDVDEAPVFSQRFTVRAIPTMPAISQGQVLARPLAAASVAALQNLARQITRRTHR